mgnify:FL=1
MSDPQTEIEPITNSTLALATLHDDTLSKAQRHKLIIKEATGVALEDPSMFLMELANEAKTEDRELAFKCASEVMKNQTKTLEMLTKEDTGQQASVNINMNSNNDSMSGSFDLDDM